VAGTAVSLSAASTSVGAGRTVASYSWTLAAGSAGAAISGPANAATLSVMPARSGSFTAFLTVTDNLGAQDTQSLEVTVASSASDDDGGGGGAMQPAWLWGLAAAAALLRGGRRRA
jgi:MYXO-CTERM domain-containing protein